MNLKMDICERIPLLLLLLLKALKLIICLIKNLLEFDFVLPFCCPERFNMPMDGYLHENAIFARFHLT
jgi:hypothetical protein